MKIGELAETAQTQSETIRYYERQGLLPEAERSAANYRVYGQTHVGRLAFIRHCRSLDMTLAEIKTLLEFKDSPDENCQGVNTLLDEHIVHVANRIRELKALQLELKSLRQQCAVNQEVSNCGILSGLEKAASKRSHARRETDQGDHVHGTHQQVG
jgi:Cd(II)/Pb(II)-responsive transcriptional regulator